MDNDPFESWLPTSYLRNESSIGLNAWMASSFINVTWSLLLLLLVQVRWNGVPWYSLVVLQLHKLGPYLLHCPKGCFTINHTKIIEMLFKYLSVSWSSSKLLLCMIKSNSRAGIHKLLFTPSDDHIWRISKPHHVKKVIFNWPMLAFFIWGMIFYLQISLSVLEFQSKRSMVWSDKCIS